MKSAGQIQFIKTIKERCRVCYTCVRECPAKAIRIVEGQAEVMAERCICCGNCVRVCSQHAKQVVSSIPQVAALLGADRHVAAIIAPSFPAEFPDVDYRKMVGMVRSLGFDCVTEVAFGADLVAERYRTLLTDSPDGRFIATSCPAIVGYVERYHPDFIDCLAPVVSPMVAEARVLHALHGDDMAVVFVGPCIAKKGEAASENVPDEIDAVLTFGELRAMFQTGDLTADAAEASDFDPPHPGLGALFPVSRGLLQAAHITEDLVDGEVVATDGRSNFVDAIKEFGSGSLDARLLEVLCCNGCIMGAGMSTDAPMFRRRSRVSAYVRECVAERDPEALNRWHERFADLDLSRGYSTNDQRIPVPSAEELSHIMHRLGKFRPEDELNCGACGYDTCREHAVAIYKGLAESEMCLPYTIEQLRSTIGELAETQEALMQSEKLAGMGKLAAGIAHEVNNPLGVVLMYAHLTLDECQKGSELESDLKMIVDEADRCKKIVAGLLHFARQNKVLRQRTDVKDLVERSLQGVRPPENVKVVVEHEVDDASADLDKHQVIQVLTNLVSNAYAAMPDGGVLLVRTSGDEERVRITVADSGVGIKPDHLNRIFEPFFTTKQIGKGTGLGLAVAYGIVKMHRGDVEVKSNSDPAAGPTGTTFSVILPRHEKEAEVSMIDAADDAGVQE